MDDTDISYKLKMDYAKKTSPFIRDYDDYITNSSGNLNPTRGFFTLPVGFAEEELQGREEELQGDG